MKKIMIEIDKEQIELLEVFRQESIDFYKNVSEEVGIDEASRLEGIERYEKADIQRLVQSFLDKSIFEIKYK